MSQRKLSPNARCHSAHIKAHPQIHSAQKLLRYWSSAWSQNVPWDPIKVINWSTHCEIEVDQALKLKLNSKLMKLYHESSFINFRWCYREPFPILPNDVFPWISCCSSKSASFHLYFALLNTRWVPHPDPFGSSPTQHGTSAPWFQLFTGQIQGASWVRNYQRWTPRDISRPNHTVALV